MSNNKVLKYLLEKAEPYIDGIVTMVLDGFFIASYVLIQATVHELVGTFRLNVFDSFWLTVLQAIFAIGTALPLIKRLLMQHRDRGILTVPLRSTRDIAEEKGNVSRSNKAPRKGKRRRKR